LTPPISPRRWAVLVELSVMEQRYQAIQVVVQDGRKVTEVAEHLGVSRQSVHAWIVRYEAGRQVPQDVFARGLYRAALQFGFEMGTGVRTYVPATTPYLLAAFYPPRRA
jgi:transposase-like protein